MKNLITRIKWWLVKKLVGDRPVLMNVTFTALGHVKSTGKPGLIYKSKIKEVPENEVKSDNA